MPTYKDLDRVSNQSCIIAYDVKAKLTDLSFARPSPYYEFERFADFTIGGHFGCSASVTTQFVTTGSFPFPPPFGLAWSWSINAVVVVDNGHGVSTTQTVVLKSGTNYGPFDPLYTPFVVEDIAVAGTFNFSCNSEILYDITESQPGGAYMHPPYTVLNQYERSTVGGVATCTVVLNGQTVTATGAIASAQSTTYNFDAYVRAWSKGSLAGKEQAILSLPLINSIQIPNNGYLFARNSDQFVESTATIKAVTLGADDAFGDPVQTEAELTSSATLERNIKNKGWVNAYNNTYPNELDVDILNFDGGTRTVTFNGSYDETESFKKYSYNSSLLLVTALTDTVNFDDIPAGNFKNTITSASLIANDDYQYNTRMPFRGWWFDGASLYHSKYTVLSGSGNTYTFNDPNRLNFSGYRLIEVNAVSNTGGVTSADFFIRYGGNGTEVLQDPLSISATASNYLVDLCYAYNLHSSPTDDLSSQDNPYPRANPNSNYDWASQKLVNDDLYGIGQVGQIRLDGNVTVNSFKLYRDDNVAKADFIAPISESGSGFTQVFTGTATTSYYGRRYWHQDVQGRNDEEYDLLQITSGGTTYVPQTIAGFIDNITNLEGYQGGRVHLGWTGNSSTPNDSSTNLRDGYLNEDGYMSWLMGFGMEYVAGTQKFGFDRDLSEEANDYDIYAQTIFDEINCDFIPDYVDPFALESPGQTELLLYGFNCQRGPVHGLWQLQQLGQTVSLQDNFPSIRGSSVTDVRGRYQTSLPFGQAETPNNVFFGVASIGTSIITAKRNRAAYYSPTTPVVTNLIKAGDLSGWYQHLISYTDDTNIVNFIYTNTPDFSNFIYQSTNITDSNNVAVRWKPFSDYNEIILAVEKTSGVVEKYICDSLATGVSGLATTLGTGTQPALAINGWGSEFYFFRTTDSGGSIKRVGIDNSGTIFLASSIVITGNVTTEGLASYCFDDKIFLIYNHSVNGITVVSSDDNGVTFS
jgi:hypothetical protein